MAMNQVVRDFYNSNADAEWERLDLPLCRIEFLSTLHLIDTYFPKQGRVCDLGSGPGRYSIELIRRGYAVTLLDLSDDEIQMARAQLDKLELSAEQLIIGDAQNLTRTLAKSGFGRHQLSTARRKVLTYPVLREPCGSHHLISRAA